MRILFLPGTSSGPPARFRLLQFVPYLQKLGHQVDVHIIKPERNAFASNKSGAIRTVDAGLTLARRIGSLSGVYVRANQYDVIMMNRDLVPERRVQFLEPLLAKRNPHLIFDFDDAIHLARSEKLARILPYFALLTPGNDYLATYSRTLHQHIKILPTVVDTDYYRPAIDKPVRPLIRIGWSGSESSAKVDLQTIEPVITRLAQKISFEFIVISNVNPKIHWNGVNSRFIQWTPETEAQGLHEIDIGIMPLKDEPFQRGKCSLKAIQYMGNGIPAVVSPVGANITVVPDGITGFHASTDDEWIDRLDRLVTDTALRQQMGAAGREHVVANYSIKSLLPKMVEAFEYVASL